jgi:iron complex outermembrane receptor protein
MKTLVSAAVFAALTTTAIAEPITIFISGNRSETPGLGIPAATTVIGAKEIEESGASNLYELFSTVNGIQVSDSSSGGGNARIDMRGFGETSQSNVAILINNQKINTTTDATVWNLHAINLDNVERIEIIRGSSGALYGSQVVGGLINIITKDVIGDKTSIKQSLGSYNTTETSVDLARSTYNIGSIDTLVTHINAYKKKSDGYRYNNALEVERLDLGMRFNHGNNITTLNVQSLFDHLQTPGALSASEVESNRRQSFYDPTGNTYTTPASPAGFLGDFTENKTNTLTASHKRALTSKTDLDISGRYQKVERTFKTGGRTYTGTQYNQDKWIIEINPHFLTSSIYGSTSYGFDLNNSSYSLSSGQSNKQKIYAGYAQHEIQLTQELSATTGARYSTVTNELYNSFSSPTTGKTNGSFFVKSIGLNYSANKNLRFFARADENFRFAKVDEHTNAQSGIGLKDQNGISYEVGGDFNVNKFKVNAVLSRLNLENEITSKLVSGTPYNFNLDKTTKDSLQVNLEFAPRIDLVINGGAEFIDAQITGGAHDGSNTPGVAEKTFNLSATWLQNKNTTHSLSSKWIGEQFLTTDFNNDRPKLDSYKIFNYNFNHKIEDWNLGLRIENLTNEKYISFGATAYGADGYYPAPERNFMLTAKYTFE